MRLDWPPKKTLQGSKWRVLGGYLEVFHRLLRLHTFAAFAYFCSSTARKCSSAPGEGRSIRTVAQYLKNQAAVLDTVVAMCYNLRLLKVEVKDIFLNYFVLANH